MATLRIREVSVDGSNGSALTLRQWLDGRWAILFSHPDDFLRCELEVDRWLHLVGDAFKRARIRPLALSRRNQPIDRGWVSQLTGEARFVSLHERIGGGVWLDFHGRSLGACIERLEQRFAMIIDATLQQRRTVLYGATEQPPSPLDLVHLACRLRNEQVRQHSGEEHATSELVVALRGSRGVCALA